MRWLGRVSLRRDHQADQAEIALLDRLSAEQVALVRFEFSGDPRACYSRRDPGLPQVAARANGPLSDHRLLVFTEGENLLDPHRVPGFPASWLDQCLRPGRSGCVIDPLPRESWGGREAELEASGFFVEPATTEGLDALRRIAATEAAPLGRAAAGRIGAGPTDAPRVAVRPHALARLDPAARRTNCGG